MLNGTKTFFLLTRGISTLKNLGSTLNLVLHENSCYSPEMPFLFFQKEQFKPILWPFKDGSLTKNGQNIVKIPKIE